MAGNFDIAEKIIRAEYQRLCNISKLYPVPLDIYICEDDIPADKKTTLGFPFGNCDPAYSGKLRLMALPLCEGDDWPTIIPSFPPQGFNKYSNEWPIWRIELWHETVHQISNDLYKEWNPKEPGRKRSNGTISTLGHGIGWFDGIKHLASLFGLSPDDLDALLDQ